jgi:rhodanese-related sulfurtransferase
MSITNIQHAHDQKENALMEIERRGFFLKTLHNTARELNSLEDIEEMIALFLMVSMGTLGITRGFVFTVDTESLTGKVTSRGFDGQDTRSLSENVPQIVERYFSDAMTRKAHLPVEASLIAQDGLPDSRFFPAQTSILIKWRIDKDSVGLFGLGEKILAKSFSEEEVEFLLGLTNSFLVCLKNMRSMTIIRQLNRDLHQKNIEQKDALKEAERIRKQLDERVFHLNVLYDTTHELSALTDMGKIMETFLLTAMGAVSVEKGYILLFDSQKKEVLVVSRGIDKGRAGGLSAENIEGTLPQFFEAVGANDMTSTKARIVSSEKLLGKAILPMEVGVELFFSFNSTCRGLVGLGKRITGQGYTSKEKELLQTITNNFMVFGGNAKSFETIRGLNTDLEKRNVELTKTVEELSASKLRIEGLERAKARVKTLIQKEMERKRKVSLVDFVLIIVVAFGLGIISNLSNPDGIGLVPQIWLQKSSSPIDINQAKLHYDTGISLLVDARPPNFFKQEHIRGAVNLPMAIFDFLYMMKFSGLDPAKEIIVYGRTISRHYDEEVAFKLTSRGHSNVKVLPGGLPAWKEKGYHLVP